MRRAGRRRVGRNRGWRRATAVVVVSAVGLLASCSSSDADPPTGGAAGRPTDGPVTFADTQTVQRAGVYAIGGDHVIFGATTITNTGSSPATLQAAHLVGDIDPADAAVTEVRVVDLGLAPGSGDLLGASKWPDAAQLKWWQQAVPIAGANLPSGNAAEVVFLIKVHDTGDWRWKQSAMDYEIDGHEYATVTNFGFQVCPPKPEECSS